MALVWADGFETYANATDMDRFWTTSGGISTSGPRTGARCTAGAGTFSVPNQSSYVAGVAHGSPHSNTIMQFSGATNQALMILAVNSLNFVTLEYWPNGVNTTITSSLPITSGSTYHYFEVKVTNTNTGLTNGTITVHIDGVHWPSLDVSGVKLTDFFNAVTPIAAIVLNSSPCDDFYVCDLTGGQNNDFLGPISVYGLWATANGNTNQWTATQTPNTGANAYKNVNETTPDGDTSYNATSTVGNIEDYAFSNASIPATQSLLGVIAMAVVRDDLAGAAQVAPYLEQGVANNTGTAVGVSTSYIGVAGVYDSNPNTSAAWVMSDINSLSAGLKRTA